MQFTYNIPFRVINTIQLYLYYYRVKIKTSPCENMLWHCVSHYNVLPLYSSIKKNITHDLKNLNLSVYCKSIGLYVYTAIIGTNGKLMLDFFYTTIAFHRASCLIRKVSFAYNNILSTRRLPLQCYDIVYRKHN